LVSHIPAAQNVEKEKPLGLEFKKSVPLTVAWRWWEMMGLYGDLTVIQWGI
jgi:hypothetical protein